MKNISVKYLLMFIAVAATYSSFALETIGVKSKVSPGKGNSSITAKGAQCEPSETILRMQFNEVGALLQQGGRLFQDQINGNIAGYEVPRGTNLRAIFAGSLWMGGVDVNGQLKLAAVRFRQDGNDFWAGPLTVDLGSGNYNPAIPAGDNVVRDFGPAEISPDQCEAYDRFFTIRKGEVINFYLWWLSQQPGYVGEDVPAPANEVMNRIVNWPAHGEASLNQDYYLAPFYDNAGPFGLNDAYDPMVDGDYPWYDDILSRDDIECGVDRRISLFGDETHWWIFNDKGNIHTETGGDPIGMEIRAQAFCFATDDEVNRMTFYNYELINRGVQTLNNTFFSQWLDPDLGFAADDYIGCDVSRGLGYAYNGDNFDESNGAALGYGANPPAIGVDFFEGPYQDADGRDNPGPFFDTTTNSFVVPSVLQALAENGIVYSGIGTGYSDGIVDNERFGMRRFTYFTNAGTFPYNDPSTAPQHYNFMSGSWADGSEMFYGGTGAAGFPGSTSIVSDYMFPNDSDPLHWGTAGVDPGFSWSENNTGGSQANPAGDRRFVQSAGPFTLRPGAVNNITVGIAFGRSSGGLFASVDALVRADTKAQALFDACFRILSPPDAPRLRIQELENSLILTLDNPIGSNNFNESYEEEDEINIVDPTVDRFYRFEGYQIYQMSDAGAGISDITDNSKARLVAQCDIRNFKKNPDGTDILSEPIGRLINFEQDENLGFAVPTEKVNGENRGIRYSFELTEDQFAQGTRTLVNHKTYYYIAIAYAYNNFKDYSPTDPNLVDGQQIPYISSRLSFDKTAIQPVSAVPHAPIAEAGGTFQFANYGETPEITKIDGFGNGGRILELTDDSEATILRDGVIPKPTYKRNFGPINVKVVDPLNVAEGNFELEFINYTTNAVQGFAADAASWIVRRFDNNGNQTDSVTSNRTIEFNNEQIIPKWGVSIQIQQQRYFQEVGITGGVETETTDILDASIDFADSSKRWLTFVPDQDNYSALNWIRSGSFTAFPTADFPFVATDFFRNAQCYRDEVAGSPQSPISRDPDRRWSRILGGGLAPHTLVGYQCDFMPLAYWRNVPNYPASPEPTAGTFRTNAAISFTPSIDIVMTSDQSKWTRCPVIELGRDRSLNVNDLPQPNTQQALPGGLRKSPSVGKDGRPDGTGFGMGWFPGYAIDIESGVRLNMAFGENSFLATNNGADMLWNPTSNLFGVTGNPLLGGMHPVYVFSYKQQELNGLFGGYNMGAYTSDASELKGLFDLMETNNGGARNNLYSSLSWVGYPFLVPNRGILDTDVRIRVRLNKEYKTYNASGENQGRPKFGWSMDGLAPQKGSRDALAQVLDIINVVPNPYYAFSEYERNRLDTRIKITNLPEVCQVRIYSTNGRLVRSFKKDSPITSIDWDLNNQQGIPVASGVYLIHVDVPGVGEVVLKFFSGIRQVDLQGI